MQVKNIDENAWALRIQAPSSKRLSLLGGTATWREYLSRKVEMEGVDMKQNLRLCVMFTWSWICQT